MIIEVDKKYFIGIVAVILILGGIFFVVSYGTSAPATFGHTMTEIDFGTTINVVANTADSCSEADWGKIRKCNYEFTVSSTVYTLKTLCICRYHSSNNKWVWKNID